MKSPSQPNQLHRSLLRALRRRQLKPTPQALASLLQSVLRAPTEVLGDTDSILLGLLFSGSYTVDILETAGVDAHILRNMAELSVDGPYEGEYEILEEPPVDYLLKQPATREALQAARHEGGVLETSHLLQASMSALSGEVPVEDIFPIKQRRDGPSLLALMSPLEKLVCELISYAAWLLRPEGPHPMLVERRTPVTSDEDAVLDRVLGGYHPEMEIDELEFTIRALDVWFTERSLLVRPTELCVRTVNRCSTPLFARELFMNCGGNFDALSVGLNIAKRFSPERDMAGLALFNREGRIHVGQYTYRNTFLVETYAKVGLPHRRIAIQAVRPVSLIAREVIGQLENILSRASLRELEIQAFLKKHPEVLESLGYAGVCPEWHCRRFWAASA